ncbi:MAG: hypothetical protein Q7R31_00650 [Candidatus Levybacteria bacterium]|nr:hypothetical protein [Candidatus Levybacteria bacterium]
MSSSSAFGGTAKAPNTRFPPSGINVAEGSIYSFQNMQTLLIISKDVQKGIDRAMEICKKEEIDVLDIDINSFEKTLGIDDVRALRKRLYLKPFKSKTKAMVIAILDRATIEAQNSLLKVLEEPPNNTIIVLVSANKELFLPTVLSRCVLIELKDEDLKLSEEELKRFVDILSNLPKYEAGDKLKIAETYGKTREEANSFLEKITFVARQVLLKQINLQNENNKDLDTAWLLNVLKTSQKTYTTVKNTNVSQRFSLETLLLSS